ncbi:MCP four helix bundle domain-containing protein [Pseudopedobacter beijingensis]|uniref:MCP four helix bundle domain-containing protein n=1 Tax=Pseudopedobacter beijingensis TaxID=1207056 RepID=A0ABW4I943_9SPHI
MNWQHIFSNRIKAAIVLAILMTGIIISNFFERKILKSNKQAIESIYEDRLKPATSIFEMRQMMANRIFLLERYATDELYSQDILKSDLHNIDTEFNQLMSDYEKTYLVPEEEQFLSTLKDDIDKLNSLTNDLAVHDKQIILQRLQEVHKNAEAINQDLYQLSKMQGKIGQEILAQYMRDLSISNMINSVQIVLAIAIGIIIVMMLSNRRITLSKIEDHHLN